MNRFDALIAAIQPPGRRLDAAETATLIKQLEHIEAQTYDVKRPEFQALSFIPVDTSIPNGAETITYRQWDQYGMAKVISDFADDLPRVDVVAREFTSRIKSLGDAYGYSIQELRAAAMSGQPLDQMRAMAARRAIDSAFDDIAAFGIPEAQMPGFLNHANVPLVSVITGNWDDAGTSAEEILGDMRKLAASIPLATKGVHRPDTMLLDQDSFEIIAGTPVGTDLKQTILQVFLATNPYIKNVDQWVKLNTADVAGTGPRLVCYQRSPEVLQFKIPQLFESFPPQAKGLEFEVPCHARVGGTVIRYPLAIAYMDGIG